MTEVATKTGIPNSTLSEIVNGKHKNLSIQKALLICDAVGCSLDYLIDGEYENHNSDETLKLITEKYTLLNDKHKIVIEGHVDYLLQLQESETN